MFSEWFGVKVDTLLIQYNWPPYRLGPTAYSISIASSPSAAFFARDFSFRCLLNFAVPLLLWFGLGPLEVTPPAAAGGADMFFIWCLACCASLRFSILAMFWRVRFAEHGVSRQHLRCVKRVRARRDYEWCKHTQFLFGRCSVNLHSWLLSSRYTRLSALPSSRRSYGRMQFLALQIADIPEEALGWTASALGV
jgi:hypothetical protein